MIFPHNVHRSIRNRGKLVGQDLTNFILTAIIVTSIVLYFIINWVIRAFIGAPNIVSIILTLITVITIAITAFRFLIFDEHTKIMEYSNRGAQSDFLRYVKLRTYIENKEKVNNKVVSIFEYNDSTQFCIMRFRFGSNDKQKSNSTRNALNSVINILGLNNMVFRTITMSEDFSNSSEYFRYTGILNKMRNKPLAKHLMCILSTTMEVVNKNSNVDSLYCIIHSRPGITSDLSHVLKQILSTLESNSTSIRYIEFLNKEQLIEFYRQFYNLEVINFTTMSVVNDDDELNNMYRNVVKLHSFRSADKIYEVDVDETASRFNTKVKEVTNDTINASSR